MRWSLRLGRFLGIDVFLHATFVLLLAFVALSAGLGPGGTAAVGQAMMTDFKVLAPEDPLDRAVTFILAGSQQDFPVASSLGAGLLTRDLVIAALSRSTPTPPVGALMIQDPPLLTVDQPLEQALPLLQARGLASAPVVGTEGLVGLLTLDNITDLLLIRGSRRAAHGAG